MDTSRLSSSSAVKWLRSVPLLAAFCQAAPLLSTVDLGTAGEFALLTKTGVTTTGVTSVTGNMGTSPIAATALTGFALVLDSSGEFSTSTLVNGKVYAADYAVPTPAKMTTAISDMEKAYTDAAGRVNPDSTELGAGNIEGKTIPGGLHKWSSAVTFSASLTFDAGANPDTVWILQMAQTLVLGTNAKVKLLNGAKASNIFWQVAGQVQIPAGAHMEGIILCKTAIIFGDGASLNGRGLAQTAVTMIANTIAAPVETQAASARAGSAVVPEAEGAPQLIPEDIQLIVARFNVMQAKILELQTKATSVSQLVQQVESVGKDTMARVKVAEKDLIASSNATVTNKQMVADLKNRTELAGLKVKGVLKDIKGLMKVVDALDNAATPTASDAGKLELDRAALENKVKRFLPGSGSFLTARLDKATATIEKYQNEVTKGLGSIIEKSLRGHFKSATDSVDKLTDEAWATNQ